MEFNFVTPLIIENLDSGFILFCRGDADTMISCGVPTGSTVEYA